MNKNTISGILALFLLMAISASAEVIQGNVGTTPTTTYTWQVPQQQSICHAWSSRAQAECQLQFSKNWRNSLKSGIFQTAGIEPVNALQVNKYGNYRAIRCDPSECQSRYGAQPYFYFQEDLDSYHDRLTKTCRSETTHCVSNLH